MDLSVVKAIFKVFLNVDDTEKYDDLIDMAVFQITASAKSDADLTDRRICCAAAALACIFAVDMDNSQERDLFTSTGKRVSEEYFSNRRVAAEKLFLQMKRACSDLLEDDDFAFLPSYIDNEGD